MGLFSLEHGRAAYVADFAAHAAAIAALGVLLLATGTPAQWRTGLALAGAGLVAWTLLEYLLHRFVLHRIAPFSRWHAEHHRRPDRPDLRTDGAEPGPGRPARTALIPTMAEHPIATRVRGEPAVRPGPDERAGTDDPSASARPRRTLVVCFSRAELGRVAFFCTSGSAGPSAVPQAMAQLCGRQAVAQLAVSMGAIDARRHWTPVARFVRAVKAARSASQSVWSRRRAAA
jgi:hypothetical protein